MDLSKYAALFLAESREHLSACNRLLLEWERDPAATEPVGGLFRAVHTIKGMAATMGYAGVAELAHRLENLLDALRRRAAAAAAPTSSSCSSASVDALEQAVEAAAAGASRVPTRVCSRSSTRPRPSASREARPPRSSPRRPRGRAGSRRRGSRAPCSPGAGDDPRRAR